MTPEPERRRGTLALHTLDCARKVRIHYELPEPVGPDLLRSLDVGRLEVQEFSRHVAGASDHFTLTGDDVHASGVLGGTRIVATFRRSKRGKRERLRFESALVAAGLGPIGRVRARDRAA